MPDFKKTNRFSKPGGYSRGGGRPSFGGTSGPRRDSSSQGETFMATCSKCNNACEVPFRPNGKKPVFCKNCYVRDDARPATGGFEKRGYDAQRPAFAQKAPSEDPRIAGLVREVATMHEKLDTLIERLEGAAFSSIIAASSEPALKAKKMPAKKVAKKKAA